MNGTPTTDPGGISRGTPWTLGVLALSVGAGAGLGAIALRLLITAFTRLFSGHADYTAAGGTANGHVPWLGPYFALLAPVVGGLLYGPLAGRCAKEARGHGVAEVMLAVARRGGRIDPRAGAVGALASALCIGSGGSLGREGPVVQLASALGSAVGRVTRADGHRMRLLTACGAAGGIAATFNTPLAGVFFAMELVLRDFTLEAFAAVTLASVTADVIGRAAFGTTAFLALPLFHVDHLVQFPLFALLGVAAGAAGAGFTRVLCLVEGACDRLWRGPQWLRPAVGGLLLGALLLALPEMYGMGGPVVEKALHGGYLSAFLLLLLVGKMLAASLTIGIGGSGGVFAPSLFIGAMLGAGYGAAVHRLLPGAGGTAGAYALVGMGAVFAGASRAPITAAVVLFELTAEYTVVLPLMLAVVVATLTSRLLGRDTVYTLGLRRRGIDITGSAPRPRFDGRSVATVMERPPDPLPAATELSEAARRLGMPGCGVLPVVGSSGRFLGTVDAGRIARALAEEPVNDLEPPPTTGQIAALTAHVGPDMPLHAAVATLVSSRGDPVPVLDPGCDRLVGWLTPHAALRGLEPK
ncbi:chloride channel protein [Streptomyces sp. NPDC002536]